jgi:hypothetical protein
MVSMPMAFRSATLNQFDQREVPGVEGQFHKRETTRICSRQAMSPPARVSSE